VSIKIGSYYWGDNGGSAYNKAFTMGTMHVGPAQAKGFTGPAMASASAALASLKQLKAMWESLKELTTSDLAKLGNSGGGGGGGGSKDSGTTAAEWIRTIERWYNLT